MAKFRVFSLIIALCWLGVATGHSVLGQGKDLLNEQFKDNSHDWELATTTGAKFTIKDGILSLEATQESIVSWITPQKTFPNDIDMSVDLRTPQPDKAGLWNAGILIRADRRDQDTGFYQFQVSGDGRWGFVKRTSRGDYYQVEQSGTLNNWKSTDLNTLKVSARSTTYTFSVNGDEVGTFQDDTVNNYEVPKYVGLLVGTEKGLDHIAVQFSNLKITQGSGGPQSTAQVTGNANGILLLDTFPDDNPNGWNVVKSSTSSARIENDSLVITVSKANWYRWSVPDTTLPGDIDVTVDVIDTDSANDWFYGIGVRDYVKAKDEFMYLFQVNNKSQWSFMRLNGSKGFQTIVDDKQFNVSTFKLNDTNTLNIRAVGKHFEFFVNGKKIGEADDDQLTPPESSQIALVAGTGVNTATTSVSFSNLVVIKP